MLIIGGVLGEVFPIRIAMTLLLSITFIGCLSFVLVKSLKPMMNFDSEVENLEELIEKTNGGVKKQ